ncbi:hypothetical protein Tco_0138001 [Tanacetum coccineum]
MRRGNVYAGNDQGIGANRGVERVNGNVEGVNRGVGGALDFSMIIAQQLQNLLPAILAEVGNQGNIRNQNGSFVGKALTWWNSQICTLSQEVAVSMSWNDFKAGHAAYTDRFHELARLVPHLIRGMLAAMKPKTMQKAVQISGALINEAVRNGSIKKVEKLGNVAET